ncbi:MAG TPA: hypothetical protein VMV15_08600 [Candidatus Binataceae bacterium]|nr:hypothetical protein [Candidatus Binataceae bacterium]
MAQESLTVNGVPIAANGSQSDRIVALPSGRGASIRRGVGRDLMRAQRAAQSSEPAAIVFALIAELVRIDGQPMVYEDVLAMDLADVLVLQEEVVGGNFQQAACPPPPLSPASSSSASALRS